jgi:Protein of unknown function (DUF3293)
VRLTRGSLRRDGVVASAEISEELASARRNHACASMRLSIGRSVATTLEASRRSLRLPRAWPSERSLLVLGLSPKIAREIGAQFGQNAVVWTGADGIPGLILLS